MRLQLTLGIVLTLFVLFVVCSPKAQADLVYHVTVDTSSASGTAGCLNFSFSPGTGSGADVLIAALSNVATDGTLATSLIVDHGTVTGTSLTTGVSLTDDLVANGSEFFQNFTYATSLTFDVTISGNLPNPDPGAQFALTFWNVPTADVLAGTNNPAQLFPSSDPSAAGLIIDINPDGVIMSPEVTLTQNAVPEPSSLLLAGSGFALIILCGVKRRKLCHRRHSLTMRRRSIDPRVR